MPSQGLHPFLRHDGPIAFAHRGGSDEAPENTLPAFEAAVHLGYRYLETDVHLTRDGVLMAFHDPQLDRVTDRHGAIARLTVAEVEGADAGYAFSPDGGRSFPFHGWGVRVPRLGDLLVRWPEARWNIDPKSDACVTPLAALLDRLDAWGRVCIGAFSDRRLRRLRALGSGRACTSMGPRAVLLARIAASSGLIPCQRANCIQVPVRHRGVAIVTARFVRAAHGAGLPVHVWTINDERRMHDLLDLGVDGIMTDRPRLLRDVLAQRGLGVQECGPTSPEANTDRPGPDVTEADERALAVQAHAHAREQGVLVWLYVLARGVLAAVLRLWFLVRVSGAEHVPSQGPVIIAPNHKSFLDAFFVGIATSRHVRYMAKTELFRGPLAWLLLRVGAFPVRRGEADAEALETARRILRQGGVVVVFPEGTRVDEPHVLGSPHHGAGRLALETGAPIVPVAIAGTSHLWLGPVPKPRRVQLAFLAPIEVPNHQAARDALSTLIDDEVWPAVQRAYAQLLSTPGPILTALGATGIGRGLVARRERRIQDRLQVRGVIQPRKVRRRQARRRLLPGPRGRRRS